MYESLTFCVNRVRKGGKAARELSFFFVQLGHGKKKIDNPDNEERGSRQYT